MSDRQLADLAERAEERRFPAGATILEPGDGISEAVVLLSGNCDVLGVMDDEINHLEAGMLLGELAFFDSQARSAKAVAKNDCVVAVFKGHFLDELRASDPDLVIRVLQNVIDVLCKKLRHATRWIDAGLV